MSAIDKEIRKETGGSGSLDDLLQLIRLRQQPIDLSGLAQSAEQLVGDKLDALDINNLAGCRNIAPGNQEN